MPLLPSAQSIGAQVSAALREDVGPGDLTAGLIPEAAQSVARLWCREEAILCGVAWFNEVFYQLDQAVSIGWFYKDGERILKGDCACELTGSSRALLTGERTALNYLQTLSGTATLAGKYKTAVEGTGVRVLDTRKTIPGLRSQQKYAVACGGCHNHRQGLFDAILIKENHILAAGSIAGAVAAARRLVPGGEVEIEVESLHQLGEALKAEVHRVLLDNFSLDLLKQAVAITRGRARLEASGGVTLNTIRKIAETGVDDISVGALTKDVLAVDFSMRFEV